MLGFPTARALSNFSIANSILQIKKELKINRLTTQEYWNEKYGSESPQPISITGFRNRSNALIYNSMNEAHLSDKSILEVGAGGSQWLPFLAQQNSTSSFTGLDYAEAGCKELEERAILAKVNIKIVQADLFEPPESLLGKYDLVITFGVVEHFDDLENALRALVKYLKPGGKLYTIIPNMAGSIGTLTRWLNKDVYDIHNPHNLQDLVKGHNKAGLAIEKANYLCSTDFGVLSACITENTNKRKVSTYLWLTRLTKIIYFIESKLSNAPATRLLSPYIYCIATKDS